MTINSYGYEVMSLDEVIEALTKIKEQFPEQADKPLWVDGIPPLYWPVKAIWAGRKTGDAHQRVYLTVERGR